jgi:hypothetical protein
MTRATDPIVLSDADLSHLLTWAMIAVAGVAFAAGWTAHVLYLAASAVLP